MFNPWSQKYGRLHPHRVSTGNEEFEQESAVPSGGGSRPELRGARMEAITGGAAQSMIGRSESLPLGGGVNIRRWV